MRITHRHLPYAAAIIECQKISMMTKRYAHLEPRESAVRVLDSQDSGHTEGTLPFDEDARRAVTY